MPGGGAGAAGGRRCRRTEIGLHPRLGGLLNIFNEGRLALVHVAGTRTRAGPLRPPTIFGTTTANTQSSSGSGWLGRYLDTLLDRWTRSRVESRARAARAPVGAIRCTRDSERDSTSMRARIAVRLRCKEGSRAGHRVQPGDRRPHLAFVNSTSRGAIETLDRVAQATSYTPTVAYPNSGFGLALRTVAGAIVRGVGSRVYWVQTGGFDTHAQQGASGGAYGNLMGALGDGLWAFYSDVRNQGLATIRP